MAAARWNLLGPSYFRRPLRRPLRRGGTDRKRLPTEPSSTPLDPEFPFHFVSFCFVSFYFVLFYFVLFYFVLPTTTTAWGRNGRLLDPKQKKYSLFGSSILKQRPPSELTAKPTVIFAEVLQRTKKAARFWGVDTRTRKVQLLYLVVSSYTWMRKVPVECDTGLRKVRKVPRNEKGADH